MPPRVRLEVERSIEISIARLSDRIGCGQMLQGLPKFDREEPLVNVMGSYGYTEVFADRPAQKILSNRGLLKSFYENAFTNKTKLRNNFHQVYREQNLFLAHDPKAKLCWFVADPQNRMALVNYYRDAASLGLKSLGITLIGATVRLTPVGWQNLHDLLTDRFFELHSEVKRVEVLAVLSGVRWREPNLGLGLTFLNLRELNQISQNTDAALRGESGGEIEN
jgi:hypothetical protein